MQLTLTIPEDVAALLESRARRSGETPEDEAAHLLRASLVPLRDPISLETPDKWAGMTPSQILYEMDLEEYEEKLDRAGRQSSALRS